MSMTIESTKTVRTAARATEAMTTCRYLIKQRINDLKTQRRVNVELNAKTRSLLASLNVNITSPITTTPPPRLTSNNRPSGSSNNKNRQALVDYVNHRECYMQHVIYWHQCWLFTHNPIYEYEKCEGFENPNYYYKRRRITKRRQQRQLDAIMMMHSSVDSLTDIYESMLDLNTTSSSSDLIRQKQGKEVISSPESHDSGLHSDDRHSSSNSSSSSVSISNCSKKQQEESRSSLYSSSCSTTVIIESSTSSPKITPRDDEVDDDEIVHPEQHELPLGWVKCCDEEGIYYWHKPTGTVTRTPPIKLQPSVSPLVVTSPTNISTPSPLSSSVSPNINNNQQTHSSSSTNTPTSCSSSPSTSSTNLNNNKLVVDNKTKRNFIRFYVHSLGWLRIDESDLTPERSSRAVNKCINDLTRCRGYNDLNDGVARWGEGKELYLDLLDNELLLVDPIDEKVLNKQSVSSIRVWGVGRDSGRDFAYVAKDKETKIYMCHVFRCDSAPAKDIANALQTTCKKILNEKKQINDNKTTSQGCVDINLKHKSISFSNRNDITSSHHQLTSSASTACFLTPMPEPKKTIACKYLGAEWVERASGMSVLNDAIDRIYQRAFDEYKREKRERQLTRRRRILNERGVQQEQQDIRMEDDDDDDIDEYEVNGDDEEEIMDDEPAVVTFDNCCLSGGGGGGAGQNKERRLGIECQVVVSPSSISVYRSKCQKMMALSSEEEEVEEDELEDRLLFESRVRFLSFMGISTDIRLCGFIIHQADNKFKCHAFLCDNSAGLLCKTIEAACKLRYQKCLDAHPELTSSRTIKQQTTSGSEVSSNTSNLTRALSTRLFGLFETIKSRANTTFGVGQ